MMDKVAAWLICNVERLSFLLGSERVYLDTEHWQYFFIYDYPLPGNWSQLHSNLLIMFPDPTTLFHMPPDRFYLERGLRTINGNIPEHYFEDGGFNDLRHHNLARFSFHIKGNWHPTLPCSRGTTFVDVLDALHNGLTEAAEETDR